MTIAVNSVAVTQEAADHASIGLRVEGMSTLLPDSIIFKLLLSSLETDWKCMLSPWWFQESSIRKMLIAARDHREYAHVSLNNAACMQAREDAALSKTWGKSGSNYILVGKVIAPVRFLWGAPKSVGSEKATSTIAQGLHNGSNIADLERIPNPLCVQFYIPGMSDPKIAVQCIAPQGRFKFAHSEELATGNIDAFLTRIKSRSR
jgi:hypothetical protein